MRRRLERHDEQRNIRRSGRHYSLPSLRSLSHSTTTGAGDRIHLVCARLRFGPVDRTRQTRTISSSASSVDESPALSIEPANKTIDTRTVHDKRQNWGSRRSSTVITCAFANDYSLASVSHGRTARKTPLYELECEERFRTIFLPKFRWRR